MIQTAIGPSPLLELFDSSGEVICYGNLPQAWLTRASEGEVRKQGKWEFESQGEGNPVSYRISGGGEEISGSMSQMSVKSPIKRGQTVVIDRYLLTEL